MEISIEEFEKEILEVLESLPRKFKDKFENIDFLIEEFIRTCFCITLLSSTHSYHNLGYQIQKASEIMILEREIREV